MSDIEKLFNNYQFEAFRLETYPQYKVQGEWDNFQKYLSTGEIIQDPDLVSYNEAARDMINKGRRHIRARLIPNPMTEYFIFESKVGYVPQSKLGFEFVFIEETEKVRNEILSGLQDYWLFDKSTVLKMSYSSDGVFKSIQIDNDEKLLEKCLRVRDYFIQNGMTLSYLRDKYL